MIEHGNLIGDYEVNAMESLELQDKFREDVWIMQNLYCKRTARMKNDFNRNKKKKEKKMAKDK